MIQILERIAIILEVWKTHVKLARKEIIELADESVVLLVLLTVHFPIVDLIIELEPCVRRAALKRGAAVDVHLASVARAKTGADRSFGRPFVQFPVTGWCDGQEVRPTEAVC